MRFAIACILLILSIAAIVILALKLRRVEQKNLYIGVIALLSVLALALLAYMLLTLILVGGVN